tara:strand:- start:11945 stop:13153 length:1209 start_codon:yes stop_codon:yes gene_type:complete
MKCRKSWSEKFIVINLNRSFVTKDLSPHRKQVILEKELARIPDTIPIVEKIELCKDEEKAIKNIAEEINILRILIHQKEVQQNIHRSNIRKIKQNKIEEKKFIMPCPNEDCRGFLSNKYYCSLCKLHTCPKCIEIIGYNKNEEHICDENKVANADLIKKETKPCPSCGERIFKTDGCDQMWCTKQDCNTAFSWKTGEIEKGVIHNPHYYEFQRNQNNGVIPRNPGDVADGCGNNLIGIYSLNKIKSKLTKNKELIKVLLNIHRLINYIINVEIPNKRAIIQELEDNQNIRVEYIIGNIDKKKMATLVSNNYRKRKEFIELVYIFELLSNIGIEMFNSLINSNNNDDNFIIDVIINLNNINNVQEYCNNQFINIGITYNHKVPQVTDDRVIIKQKFKMNELKD